MSRPILSAALFAIRLAIPTHALAQTPATLAGLTQPAISTTAAPAHTARATGAAPADLVRLAATPAGGGATARAAQPGGFTAGDVARLAPGTDLGQVLGTWFLAATR